jgi:hypothetical protein
LKRYDLEFPFLPTEIAFYKTLDVRLDLIIDRLFLSVVRVKPLARLLPRQPLAIIFSMRLVASFHPNAQIGLGQKVGHVGCDVHAIRRQEWWSHRHAKVCGLVELFERDAIADQGRDFHQMGQTPIDENPGSS